MSEMTESTIQQDVPGFESDEAVFLKKFAETSEETPQEPAETPEETPEERDAEVQEETELEAPEEGLEAPDDAVVKVKVNDKDLEFKVGDLKRLAGQEAELTRKSQEVSAVTKRATEETEKAVALTDAMIQRADKLWTDMGYDKVDLNLAAQRLPENAYKQLKADMEALHGQRRFLREEGGKLVEAHRAARAAEHQKALSTVDANVARDVPGWTKETRLEVVAYAKSQGLASEIADNLADPSALKVIRKAMLFDKGSAAATKVKPTAVSAPAKTLKPGSVNHTKPDPLKAAKSRLRSSGSLDDAEAVFLARFQRG